MRDKRGKNSLKIRDFEQGKREQNSLKTAFEKKIGISCNIKSVMRWEMMDQGWVA